MTSFALCFVSNMLGYAKAGACSAAPLAHGVEYTTSNLASLQRCSQIPARAPPTTPPHRVPSLSGFGRIERAEPILAAYFGDVGRRSDLLQRCQDFPVAAGIAWHSAAAAYHVQTDADMVGANRLD